MRWREPLRVAALALVPLLVIGVFFCWPVAGMVGRGFWPAGRLDAGGVLEVLGRSRIRSALWFTVWSAAAGTALSVLLGVPVAFALHRLRFPGRGLVEALVTLPFVMPTVVVGVAFRRLIAANGPLGWLHLDGTAVAIVAAFVFFNLGVVVRTVGAHWAGIDKRREEAAAALGASPGQVLWTVTLPALRAGIVSSASVVFLFCSTAFGVVLTMGGLRYANIETEIYQLTTEDLDLQAAAALSVLQVVVITTLLAAAGHARGRAVAVQRAAGAVRRPGLRDLPVLAVNAGVACFVAAPLVVLLDGALRTSEGWGTANFADLGGTGSGAALLVPAWEGLLNSLVLAAWAAAVAMSLGLVVALLVATRPRGRAARRLQQLFDGLFMLPLGVSAVTLGFGFLITLDRPPLDLRSSLVLIPIAQALVALPLVVRTVAPALASVDPRQRQVAASLGASAWQVVRTVDLPLVWRPVLAATGFAFAVSLGEFGATSFLARSDRPTLPVVIYQLVSHPGQQNFGMAMAASVLLVAATAVIMLAVGRLRVGSLGAF